MKKDSQSLVWCIICLFICLPACCSITTPPSSPSSCVHDENNFRCVEYVKNYDGDTITFNIPGVHPIIGNRVKVRLLNVDTAEIKTKEECEKQKARQAQKVVENLLKPAKRIDLENIQRGKYFRIVADVKIGKNIDKNTGKKKNKISLGDYLIKNNLAYYYKGKKKPRIDWCSKNF